VDTNHPQGTDAGNSHEAEPCEQARRAAYGRANPGTGTGRLGPVIFAVKWLAGMLL
jgi:hypothetical protein